MSRLLAERLRDEARRQPTDLAALLEVAADRLEQYEEEAVATRDSVTEALLEAQRRDLAAAPAVQGEPVGYVRRSAIELMAGDELGVRANIIKEPRYPDCVALYTAPQPAEQQPAPDVKALVEALEQGFPLLSDEGLDEVEHHCEWVIQRERKRVHSILAAHRIRVR